MRRFQFLLISILACSISLSAQTADKDRIDSGVFIGLDFADREGQGDAPTLQFGAHADFTVGGPLFVGGAAYIFQGLEGAWVLEPKVSVEAGFEIQDAFKIFGSLEDVLNEEREGGYGVGVRFQKIDIRAVRQSEQWGIVARIDVIRF